VAVREYSPAPGEQNVPVRPMPATDLRAAGLPGAQEHGSFAAVRPMADGTWYRRGHGVHRFMTNRPLAFLGFLLIVWACVTGGFKVLEIPDMMAANVFGDDVPRDLTRALGYAQWPNLLENVAVFLCNGALLLGAFLLLLARRRAGLAHMGRAVLGVLLFGFGMYALDFELQLDPARINVWLDEERIGPLLEYVLAQLTRQSVLITVAIVMAAGVLLAWPERDRARLGADDAKGVA
jgi:hypothetical protein